MRAARHLTGLNHILRQQTRKAASPGERVIASVFPSRGSGYPGFWFSDRIQQVYHYRNWQYICIDLIARKKASVTANLCYKTDRPIKGATVKACQRALTGLMGGGFGADPYVGQRLLLKSSVNDPRTTATYGNYVGLDGWDRPTVYDAKTGRVVQDGNPTPTVGFSGGGHSFLTLGEWRSKALSVVKPQDNLMPLEADHPYRRLTENPNPIDTPYDVAYETRMFKGLCGIAYVWTPKNQWGQPCEKWVIPSHWVYPRTGAGQYVPFNHEHADELVWDYEIRPWGYPGYAGVLHFPPDEVIVYRDKHPLSKIDGWSKLAAGAQVIDLEEAITQRQWSQLINLGVPGMVVKAPPGYEDWDDNDMARVEAKFWNRIQGAFQHGQSLMVPNGAEVEPWGYNPTEMAFQPAEEQARDRVLSLHGVPKAAIGLVDNMTYGSVMATLGTLHALVINPELVADGQTETKHLASQFDERAPAFSTMSGGGHGAGASERKCVCFYDDTVPADPQQVNADLQLDIQANCVTPNEVRALRGRQPFKRGGDNPIVNGPGGPMPLEINAEEKHIDDLAAIIAQMTSAEGKQTGEQQTESDQAKLDAGDEQPTADDHGPTGLEPPEETNGKPSKRFKALDRLGGEEPGIATSALAANDFITLPKGVTGTNCHVCRFQKDGLCRHPKLDGQPVNERNCCALWDADGTLRDWRKSLQWVHPTIRGRNVKTKAEGSNNSSRSDAGGDTSGDATVGDDNIGRSLVREFPDVRQDNHWRCGAACFAAVCQHYGVAMTVDEASKVLGTNVQHSTDPAAIIRELRKRGIAAKPMKDMTVERLAECTDAGNPVIVCLQDYGERREEGASFAYGHYMVALEASHGVVIFQDPSIENVEREPGGDVPRSEQDASGNVAMPGRVVLDGERLMEVWHDQRANGEKLVRFGIACGPRTSKGPVSKAAGDRYEAVPVALGTGRTIWRVVVNGKPVDTFNSKREAEEKITWYKERDAENPEWNKDEEVGVGEIGKGEPKNFFETCERDDKGHCTSGRVGNDGEGGGADKLSKNRSVAVADAKSSNNFEDLQRLGYRLVGAGSHGAVYEKNGMAIKEANGDPGKRESAAYNLLAGIDGISPGESVGNFIVMPFYSHVFNAKREERPNKVSDKDKKAAAENWNRIVASFNEMSSRGLAYYDLPNIGFDEDGKSQIIDFSNSRVMDKKDAKKENDKSLEMFASMYGIKRNKSIGPVGKGAGTCGVGERSDLTGCTPASGVGGGSAAESQKKPKKPPPGSQLPTELVAKLKVGKGAGTCKPGERSDLTGCQPSGGGGGASKPDNRGGNVSAMHDRFAEIGGKIERQIARNPEAKGRFREAYSKVANVVKRLAINETPAWALDLADQWVFEEVLNAAGRNAGLPGAVILTKAAAWGAAKAYLTTRKLVTGKAAGDRVEETILELLTAVAEAAGVDPPTADAVRGLLRGRVEKGNINPADVTEIADHEAHGRSSMQVPRSLGNPDVATPAMGKRTAPRNYMTGNAPAVDAARREYDREREV